MYMESQKRPNAWKKLKHKNKCGDSSMPDFKTFPGNCNQNSLVLAQEYIYGPMGQIRH